MKYLFFFVTLLTLGFSQPTEGQSPENIQFIRQGVKRLIFDTEQAIPLASLRPTEAIGFEVMYPVSQYAGSPAAIAISDDLIKITSDSESQTGIWFGGFNPFATYTIELVTCKGEGAIGYEFSDYQKAKRFIVSVEHLNQKLVDARVLIINKKDTLLDESILTSKIKGPALKGNLILQMLGSGFTLYLQNHTDLPVPIGQSDFNQSMDLREKRYIQSFQSSLFIGFNQGEVAVKSVRSELSTGIGLADIRAITYENGDPMLDQGRLWYTMSIRGRALPHHIQGIFSLNPTVFDLKLEGVVVFDRDDGLLRNEIASHIFYDRHTEVWRGITTGFSAFANPEKEEKQLLTIESKADPRFGFSIMSAKPFGIVGDIEDPHVIFDEEADKWRILTCENHNGYKAVVLESDQWNQGYERIAGPVNHNSTGTSIQKIGGARYCFSGSSERQIFIYTYPYLKEVGTLKMDLPPWDHESGTRVWPNVVELPVGYPFKFVALMMDRFNFPGLEGRNWSYGALYLYHGYE